MITLWLSTLALAGTLADGRACLNRLDVPCAQAVVAENKFHESDAAPELFFAANTAFHAGDFEAALALQGKANAAGFNDRWDRYSLVERTISATDGWTFAERDGFQVHYAPGVDALLVEDGFATLVAARDNLAPMLGGPVPGPTRLEIYPTGRDFTDASSLPPEAVRRTGVIALSKWSRLLVHSPRALVRGYGWRDTVAHEYIHLVVAYHTDDQTPVWLQEAIAKYLDNRWADGKDHYKLTLRQQGLLAEAIKTDTLVTIEEIGGSFATMDSADRSSLAYAQNSSQMAFAFELKGDKVLLDVLPLVKKGTDARVALATSAGFKSWDAFEGAWLTWISAQELIQSQIAALPTVVDGGDDVAADPVMAQRADLARYVRLGDLLREKERPKAAQVEYLKAVPDDGSQPSPLLSNRIAQVWLDLGDPAAAAAVLTESIATYPEFPLSWKTLGAIRQMQGRPREALIAYQRAADFNPFDSEVQEALVTLARSVGDTALAEKHDRALTILRRGGEG